MKIVTVYDRVTNRYIICEKTYELQKYYIIQFDEDRLDRQLENLVEITSYVVVQVNMGTKQFGRANRGIDVDTKEFMALRNLVHFYCNNPFKIKSPAEESEFIDKEFESSNQLSWLSNLDKTSKGSFLKQKDFFMQLRKKSTLRMRGLSKQ